jgi:hypothetical protein
MGVTVDESGQDKMALGIDVRRCRVFGFDLSAWANRDDSVTANGYGSVFEDAALGIHGHYRTASDQQVGAIFFLGNG